MTDRIQPGTMVGTFKIVEFLGRGSQADVYRVIQPTLNCERALKVLHAHWAADSSFLLRFKAEAQRMAALAHPNIVTVHNCGEDDGMTWIEMQLIPGGGLDDYLDQRGRLTIDETLDLMRQIASALDFANGKGIVHRDVKPGNVLIDNHKRSYLTDFGIAKALEGDLDLTQQNMRVGTVHYMGPERIERGEADGRSDLFSLAVMTFQLVTGRLPFDGKNSEAVMLKLLHAVPEWPEDVRRELGPAVVAAIELGLAKQPEDRPATCGEYVRAITDALGGEAPPPPPPGPVKKEPVTARFYASAVLVGMIIGGSWSFLQPAVAAPSAGPTQIPRVIEEPQDGPGRLEPPPTWPDADAVTPTWIGPTRVTVVLDGSVAQWQEHDASRVLLDKVAAPLRQALGEAGWENVRPRYELPEGAFSAEPPWLSALAGNEADIVVVLGVRDVESEVERRGGFNPDEYRATVSLVAHSVDVAASLLAAEARISEGHSKDSERKFLVAFASAIDAQVESLVEGILEDVAAWREVARDRGQVIEVVAFGREVELRLGAWLGDALRAAPGSVESGFQHVGQWAHDPSRPLLELAEGITVRTHEGGAWSRWRVSYRGQLVDLRRYVDEGLTRYLAWANVTGTPRTRTQGSLLVYELP